MCRRQCYSWKHAVFLISDIPNHEMRRPFLLIGLKIGTFSYFGADSATLKSTACYHEYNFEFLLNKSHVVTGIPQGPGAVLCLVLVSVVNWINQLTGHI
jgi:hypothetical protein